VREISQWTTYEVNIKLSTLKRLFSLGENNHPQVDNFCYYMTVI
jgi:hypothetical protein